MKYNATVIDNDDFYNVTIDGIEFTADKEIRQWGFAGDDDNWYGTEKAAKMVGVKPENFWPTYCPILDEIVGWE